MKKKGLSYVDLAISIGIFLVYVIFIFVSIRPGIKEEYTGEFLLEIVKENLKKDIYWSFEKVPIFIDSQITGAQSINTVFPFSWSLSHTLVTNSSFNPTEYDINNNLTFNLNIPTTSKTLYWVFYSNEVNYSPSQPNPATLGPDNSTYQYGIKETIVGVSENKLNNLNQDYALLKQKWHYPKSKDFSIQVLNISGEVIYDYSKSAVPEESAVYVLQWSDVFLYNDTKTIPITIRIKTW